MAGRPIHTFEVIRSERLTPHMIRVVLGGSGFDTFVPSDFTDSYVKVVIVAQRRRRLFRYPSAHPRQLQRTPEEQRPTVRTYTVRTVDTDRRETRHRLRRAR